MDFIQHAFLTEYVEKMMQMVYINKNWNFKKYTVYWYFNTSAVQWFILWVLYNGERESNTTWNVSNVPVQVQVWANA